MSIHKKNTISSNDLNLTHVLRGARTPTSTEGGVNLPSKLAWQFTLIGRLYIGSKLLLKNKNKRESLYQERNGDKTNLFG